MAARKLQQEIEKCFKQVDIGVEGFDAQYEKYEQSSNAAQREKQVDTLKKECKKLQRLRDQIKTWAAGNDVKDKGPLQEKRELIETKMEAFKAVEKEMKTKAFSKEGLLVSSKLDPKEREKDDMRDFLSQMVDELGLQIEATEAKLGQIQVQSKKKKDHAKAERIGELERLTEKYKWHQNKLELLMRALANDEVDLDDVKSVQDEIRNFVENNQEVDYQEDDEIIYDAFALDEESEQFGMGADHTTSQENQSVQDDPSESTLPSDPGKARAKAENLAARRPSVHAKSPLPSLATLHSLPVPAAATVNSNISNMRPAPLPPKPAGETLKYASAAAAGAANDVAGIGIAPLPAPPGRAATSSTTTEPPPHLSVQPSATNSPATSVSQPVSTVQDRKQAVAQHTIPVSRSPASSLAAPSPAPSAAQLAQASAKEQGPTAPQSNGMVSRELSRQTTSREAVQSQNHDRMASFASGDIPTESTGPNGVHATEEPEAESIWHLPSSLQELVDCYEEVKKNPLPTSAVEHQQMLEGSFMKRPDAIDAERPRYYKPAQPAPYTPQHYPQEPHSVFDNPALYSRLDPDALFYAFYYRQGTYQQYLAAKELKNNSWRFHKQYQTWFQRHEEPKDITEDYERGTYRFFDYESSWLNRRKADFEFRYRFLEDEL